MVGGRLIRGRLARIPVLSGKDHRLLTIGGPSGGPLTKGERERVRFPAAFIPSPV